MVYFPALKKESKPSKGLEKILTNLESHVDSIRFQALDSLAKYPINEEEGLVLLEAATKKYDSAKYAWQTIPGILISKASEIKNPDYIPKIETIYSKVDITAKENLLRYLSGYENEQSANTYMKLLNESYTSLTTLPTGEALNSPEHIHQVFPKILSYTSNSKIKYDIILFTLNCLDAGVISSSLVNQYTSLFLNESITNRKKLQEFPEQPAKNWIWDNDNYLDVRAQEGILLDILGYFNTKEIQSELNEALRLKDNKLKYFAVASLLKQDIEVDQTSIDEIAADPEIRNWVYDRLAKLGKISLFPAKYKTQQAFAEADMVNWLLYPTELGRVPDEIELMKVISVDTKTGDGVADYYIFRFRSNSEYFKDTGWMAGISGPYPVKDQPTTTALGYTFSTFEKWDSKTPEEHLETLKE